MNQAFTLKSSMQAVYSLELNSTNLDLIFEKLQYIEKTSPNLILGAPVVLNLEHMEAHVNKALLFELLTLLKGFSMLPIAVQTSSSDIQVWLKKAEIASYKCARNKRAISVVEQKEEFSTMVVESVDKFLVYAENQHVIVLGDVLKNNKVMADGNITIMGRLLGEAVAGAKGRENSEVFCKQWEGQLISIGQVNMAPFQANLEGYSCRFFIRNNRIEYESFLNRRE